MSEKDRGETLKPGSSARLAELQREWDEIAKQDAYWAICSDPDRKFGAWDRGAFFATGEREIAEVMADADRLGRPVGRQAALDFGCGVGRLTRALADRFTHATGVDISSVMVDQARELNADRPGCHFAINAESGLPGFEDASFDLVYTRAVLQHLPDQTTVERFLAEFVRVLRPDGLLVFQLPSDVSALLRLQPRRRLYLALRRLGLAPGRLYWRLGLHPMRMQAIPTPRVLAVLRAAGADALDVRTVRHPDFGFEDTTYYVAHAPIDGVVTGGST
ncbi:MAG: class I SAM-dependent methyltransferase [Solirubrobacteraceae bacterium]